MKKLDSDVLLASTYIGMGGTLHHSLGSISSDSQEDTFMQDSEQRSLPLQSLVKSFVLLMESLGLQVSVLPPVSTLPSVGKCTGVRVNFDYPAMVLSIECF